MFGVKDLRVNHLRGERSSALNPLGGPLPRWIISAVNRPRYRRDRDAVVHDAGVEQ